VALDGMARDVIERFEQPGLDPTLPPGAPGLFTDNGAVFDPLTEVGLAGRLTLNAAVDPSNGGATWRLRDGLGAVAPGPTGDARQLQRFADALSEVRVQTGGPLGPGSFSASGASSALMSFAGTGKERSDMNLTRSAAVFTEAKRTELAGGVDTDQELQSLMTIERAYAASARVIEVVDDLLDQLLRI
jgi:flagellar hook-associated protein 1 FlgK